MYCNITGAFFVYGKGKKEFSICKGTAFAFLAFSKFHFG